MEPLPPSRARRLLATYGPLVRRGTHRVYSRDDAGRWVALSLTQLVGGRRWSLALVRFDRPRSR